MSTRRTFLKMNLAVVGASLLAPAGAPDAYAETRSLDMIVFDTQLPEAKALAKRASGVINLPAGSDLYPVWRDTLKATLQESPKTIGGLTSGEAAFCLAEMARDYGYELVQSEVFDARKGFDPTLVSQQSLSLMELNQSAPVAWVMARSGVAFRSAPTLV